MATQNHKSPCSCETKSISEINSKISLCFGCSSVIFKDESGIEITTIKPSNYSKGQESAIPLFLSIPDNYKQYSFRNKEDYLKIRSPFVKQMKSFCYNFNLSKKTIPSVIIPLPNKYPNTNSLIKVTKSLFPTRSNRA